MRTSLRIGVRDPVDQSPITAGSSIMLAWCGPIGWR